MVDFSDTLGYTNREQRRKCERYMKKHKCSFLEAYNKIYRTKYRYTMYERLNGLSTDPTVFNKNNKNDTSTW